MEIFIGSLNPNTALALAHDQTSCFHMSEIRNPQVEKLIERSLSRFLISKRLTRVDELGGRDIAEVQGERDAVHGLGP